MAAAVVGAADQSQLRQLLFALGCCGCCRQLWQKLQATAAATTKGESEGRIGRRGEDRGRMGGKRGEEVD